MLSFSFIDIMWVENTFEFLWSLTFKQNNQIYNSCGQIFLVMVSPIIIFTYQIQMLTSLFLWNSRLSKKIFKTKAHFQQCDTEVNDKERGHPGKPACNLRNSRIWGDQ